MRDQVRPDEDVQIRDVTTAYAGLSVFGPKSRALLSAVSPDDFSNAAFPFNTGMEVQVGHAVVWAQRLSYTGELGYQLYVIPDFAEHVFDTLMEREAEFGIRMVGTEALNALRIDKGYIRRGTDLTYTESPHQIGLDFVCKPQKEIPLIGRDAYPNSSSNYVVQQ